MLALAAGSTMVPVYREVAALHQRERVSFARTRAFDLDEYAGLAGDDPRSFVRFLREHLVARVDFATRRTTSPPTRCAADLDAECARYEAAIARPAASISRCSASVATGTSPSTSPARRSRAAPASRC